MKTMTWEEIDKDWSGLQKRQRMELAQAIARYCIGHKLQEVANRLGFSIDWTRRQLDYAGIGAALGTPSQLATLPGKSGDKGIDRAVERLVRDFSPDVEIKFANDGSGKQTIENIAGSDAEAFQPYLDHYREQGHEDSAAMRLAKSEWAAEAAVEAGVIKEGKNKRDEKVNRILFPQDEKDTFELDFRMHMARVKAAASFLDKAKVNRLRSKATREGVALADKDWRFQVERIVGDFSTQEKE
jgi:hypothetical protein